MKGSAFLARYLSSPSAILGTSVIVMIVTAALFASVLYPQDPLRSVAAPEIWPFVDAAHPLGTDAIGRDIAAMMMHGARTTIAIGLIASIVASIIGILIGAVSGFYGGMVDNLLMRFTELFQIIPNLVFLIALVSVFGPRIEVVVLGIGSVSWTGMARLVRAEFMTLKNREFVLAARAAGMTDLRIIASAACRGACLAHRRRGCAVRGVAVLPWPERSCDRKLGTAGRGREIAHPHELVHRGCSGAGHHAGGAEREPCR